MKTFTLMSLLFLTACATKPMGEVQLPVIDRDTIKQQIEAQRETFRACYLNERKVNSKLGPGKMNAAFVIQNDGTVTNTNVLETTLHNANVEKCVLKGISAIHFDPHPAPPIEIKYPFSFGKK